MRVRLCGMAGDWGAWAAGDPPPWWAVIVVAAAAITLGAGIAVALEPGLLDPATAEAPATTPGAAEAPAQPTSDVEVTRRTRAAFVGDSYTSGAGAENPEADRWTAIVAEELDWAEQNHGFGGTGYTTAGHFPGGDTYADRIPEVAAGQPDIVVVGGGRNDIGADEATQRESVRDTFQGLRKALPDATILAVQPMWGARPYPGELDRLSEIVADECQAVGCSYLPLDNPLEGNPELIDLTGVHPNTDGHRALGTAVLEEVRPLSLPSQVPA